MTTTLRRLLTAVVTTSLLTLAATATAVADPAGPDVSSHQHPYGRDIDWGRVRTDAAADFAFVKATEGRTYTNPYFRGDYAALKAEGLIRGAYHYARPGGGPANARTQARYFVSVAGSLTGPGELPAVLDLETTGGLRPAALIDWAHAYLTEVEKLTGRTPIVYTYPSFWRTAMADSHEFTRYPLWIATYTGPAQLVGGWTKYLFWQHTDHAAVAGISTPVDYNVFAGSPADLRILANTLARPGAPTGLTAAPTELGSRRVDVHWQAPATGGQPASYRIRVDGHRAADVPATGGTGTWSRRLAPGPHTIAVAAHNAAGTGPAATTTSTVIVRPGAPTNLQIAVAGTRLTAAWAPPATDAGELRGYRVRLDDTPTVTLPPTATSYAAPGLAPGPHTLSVLAYNRVGDGRAASATATVIVKPGAPTQLALAVTGTSITATWAPPATEAGELTGYRVRLDDTPAVTLPATATGHTLTGLAPGPHTVSVTAYNSLGDGLPASATATVIIKPTPPTGLRTATTAGTLALAWALPTEPGGELTGYLVQIDDAAPVTLTADLTAYTVTGLAAGAHRVAVAAYNSAGTSRQVATSVLILATPGAPTHVRASTGPGTATLTWAAPADTGGQIAGYLVWVDGGTAQQVPADLTRYTAAGLGAGPHVLEVATYNTVGSSAPVATTVTVVVPATAPTGVHATTRRGGVTVAWAAPADPGGPLDGYRIWVDGHLVASPAPGSRRYLLTGLGAGRHTIRIAAHNRAGTGVPATVHIRVP